MEVDEIFLGGLKSEKRGRGAEDKTLVLIAFQETAVTIAPIHGPVLVRQQHYKLKDGRESSA